MERIVSHMKNFDKYRPGYYMPPETCLDWTKKERVEKAPLWCSVDLRDGNQALITPMNLEEKLEFYSCWSWGSKRSKWVSPLPPRRSLSSCGPSSRST